MLARALTPGKRKYNVFHNFVLAVCLVINAPFFCYRGKGVKTCRFSPLDRDSGGLGLPGRLGIRASALTQMRGAGEV